MFTAALLRKISWLVIVTFTTLTLQPVLGAVGAAAPAPATRPLAAGPDEEYSATLQGLREDVKRYRSDGGRDHVRAIRDGGRHLGALDAAVDAAFDDTGRALEARGVALEIRERHRQAVSDFRARRDEMKRILKHLDDADDGDDDVGRAQGGRDLDAFLDANRASRTHRALDPSKLPWRSLEPKVRAPAETPDGFAKLAPAASRKSSLAGPGPAELAETADARITQPIRDLAAALGNDPVAMYNWVRNNVEYTPTFGSVQGSDVTLAKRKGNAFDIASLLIALYRSAGVPARYVHGTIVVPAAAAMNWVGGVASPQAAQQVWGQGGVPNAGIVSGGQVTHVKLEHVWVEAWVDFVPARGRKPRQADAWVPLDASFKQYTYADGLAATAPVVTDPAAARAALLAGANVNAADGSVQNVNAAAAQSLSADALRTLNDYVRTQKATATNGDVFGARTIVARNAGAFAGALPYQTLAIGARFAELPATLRHKFRYRVYASDLDRALDNPMMALEDIVPNLAGRKVTIFYAPATQADVDLIAAFLPKTNPDGSPPTPDQMRALSLPAYLVNLRPEIRVDGVVRATGPAIRMGTELTASGAFTTYDLAGWDETTDQLVAGQATALGLDVEGMDRGQLQQVRDRLQAARTRIQAGDFAGLTGEGVAGDVVTALAWSYFAAVDQGGRASRGKSRMVDLPALSFGLAHLDIDITFSFGIARSAKPAGFALDVGHLRAVRWSKDNDRAAWILYNRIQGGYESAMEHHVPELLFVGPDTPGEGISAAKLLAKAAQAGQKIFTITAANASAALPQLALRADTIADIRNAVFSGKEVTVHQSPVVVNGWSGAGYTVLDPDTGAGGYLLDGGTNGGKLLAAIAGLLMGLVAGVYIGALVWALLAGGATIGAFLAVAFLIALIFFAINMILAYFSDEDTYLCYSGGALAGFFIALPLMAEISAAVMTIAGLLGWVFVANNAVVQCL